MIDHVGIGGLMLFFSINSMLGGLFVLFYIPETKDKTFQEILHSLQSWMISRENCKLIKFVNPSWKFQINYFSVIIIAKSWNEVEWKMDANFFSFLCEFVGIVFGWNDGVVIICDGIFDVAKIRSCWWTNFEILFVQNLTKVIYFLGNWDLSLILVSDVIDSMYPLGGFVSVIIYSLIIDKVGRKLCLRMIVIPQVVSLLLVAFGETSTMILISRIFAGFSGGCCYIAIPLFTSEVSEPK